jgi:hypothetical protein
VTAAPAGARQPATVAVVVDAGAPLGPINDDLVGLGWHHGGAPLATVAGLEPHLVRVDASLQDVSSGPDAPLALDPLLAKVAEIRAIGGEPLVILSYLPAWLGTNANGRDPTRVKPADLDAWERLVHDVVLRLATAPAPATRFEAWNEPDIPLFWQDTPLAWVDTVERSARAVAAVETETGVDLAFVGPATAVPDPIYLEPFLARFRDPTLPLDGVSWHYYGNYPFFGPDGAEFPVTEPIQPVLGRPNPLATPAVYGGQIDVMRAWVEAGLAGSGRPMPGLLLDEWNLSAAGFDLRHDTAEGAAFAAGVLAEMQDAGLDAAAFFRANDTAGVAGEHGVVTVDGIRKPAWWTFHLWQQQAGTEVTVTGDDRLAGLWAVGAADDGRATVLLASFSASSPAARTIELTVRGVELAGASVSVRRIDAAHAAADVAEPLEVSGDVVHLDLPAQSVALVEIVEPASTPGPMGAQVEEGSPREALARTGGGQDSAVALLLAAIVFRWLRRPAVGSR